MIVSPKKVLYRGLVTLLLTMCTIGFSVLHAKGKPSEEEAAATFLKFDKNGDGSLDKAEFCGLRLRWAKSRYKKSGASKKEISGKLEEFQKRLDKEFERADSNQDDQVSKSEYVKNVTKSK